MGSPSANARRQQAVRLERRLAALGGSIVLANAITAMTIGAIILGAWISGMFIAYCLVAINPRADD